ncbi:hypothetical protein RD792_009340, partial [Penstemon davidsonii]
SPQSNVLNKQTPFNSRRRLTSRSLHGVPVVDADVIARNVLKKGTRGWRKVVAAFGDDILLPSGERSVEGFKLGQILFNDTDKRKLLIRYN